MTIDLQDVALGLVADESEWNITKPRTIRLEPALWVPLEAAAKVHGHDRSTLIRQFVRWYLGVPGAQLPPRPDPETFAVAPPPTPTPQAEEAT
jgi:hypothetical protein